MKPALTEMDMNGFVYAEKEAAKSIGVSNSLMRKVRQGALKEGYEWGRVPHNGRTVVAYSAPGLRTVVTVILQKNAAQAVSYEDFETVLSASDISSPPEKKDAPENPMGIELWEIPESVTLVVVKVVKNPRIVVCRVDPENEAMCRALEVRGVVDARGLIRLQVKSSEKFVVRMAVPECRHVQGDLWRFTGKLPRFRGRF